MSYPINVFVESKDEHFANHIYNLESFLIYEDLQKRCDGKALHYVDHKNAPFIAYEIYEGFTLALKANKDSATFYVDDVQDFGEISKLNIFNGKIQRYANPKEIHSAIRSIRGIQNKSTIIKISNVTFSQYQALMAYASTASTKKELSPEDLLKKLERQDAIGIKGEDFAIEYEKKRLEKLGADPSKIDEYIIDRRKINVSQGYDIESYFGGQLRYIEVKTTTVNAEADFFFSANEFNVLKAKGEEAYIYRVVLSEDLESIVEIREIKNPFGAKDTSDFKAIAFKANLNDFEKK
ncbi:DUF3883 domain-containing protein [Acinetobacter indicus]|nr:DUF3883 domain-containing protein [Acinetobacter indicus]